MIRLATGEVVSTLRKRGIEGRRLTWTLPVIISFGLVAYMIAKAISWAFQWPALYALITEADHAIYMRQAERVLAGGSLYPAWQLAGPYHLNQLPEMYPPPTVYGLIVPLSLLPDPVWWIVPLAIVTAVVAYWRPSPWTWVGIMACLVFPHTWTSIAAGNPAMWSAAAVSLGTIWHWPAILALLKPTLAPFALVGVRSRNWWVAFVVLGIVSLALLPAWFDYATVIRNNTEADLAYSIGNFPLVVIPLLARWGRSSH